MKSSFGGTAEKLSVKLGIFFAGIPITPNQWTMISLLPAVLGFYALSKGLMMYGLSLFALSALLDGVDGAVARVTGRVTAFGAYLDGMVDRLVEAFLLFGIWAGALAPDWVIPSTAWIALLLFFGTALTSYARAYAHHRGVVTEEKKLRKMGGVLERPERLVLVFLGMLAWFVQPIYLTQALALAVVLSIVTVFQRMFFAARNAE